VDERSAGFLAVGLAKASGGPVAVACTSGTAAANLHPAVVEASESGLPLVVLTADRPPELRGAGANQTVDQLGLYDRAARLFAEVGAATERAGEVAYWRALACRALAAATGALSRDPGPVHLNCAFREPLVPDADPTWPEPLDGRPDGAPWTRVQPAAPERAPIDGGPHRTLVVVGDAPLGWGEAAVRLAESRGWPVLSEPSGNARRGPSALTRGHVLLDRLEALGLVPDRVLVIGRPTLWRPVQALLRRADIAVEVCAPTARWADAARSAVRVLPAVPEPGHAHPVDTAWLDAWRAVDAEAAAEASTLAWGGPLVARALVAGLPAGSLLYAGSSLPARDLAWAAPRDGVTVLANRGAAGIDGTVSSAVGAALAWQAGGGGPAWALLGDLTFLHDAGGLLLGPDEPRPDLCLVVANNDGGGIFGLIEPGRPEHADAYERVFATPVGADLAALCGASGTPYTRVADLDALRAAALDPRLARPGAGLSVVEARIPR
jgi:2-succinyl-5-enolpyruvyl-6-hydroxy-3-cyclohexene-1-carboxylate synthase